MIWYEPKFFKPSEFMCKCGCGEGNMSQELMAMLDEARDFSGRPYVITSGRRCPEHNRKEGGSPTSSHLKGLASDISCPNNRYRGAILAGLFKAGFRRIGLAKTFIHADIDSKKSGAVWLYPT